MFRRSPWPFVGFVLLSFGCSLALELLPEPTTWIGNRLIDLWASIGLMRGIWLGLQDLTLQLLRSPIALLLLLLGAALNLYLQVNQAFLGYMAVLQGLGPIQALQVGIITVQRLWWSVLGVLACGFGLLAAIPVVTGMSASAYRQLFGDDDAAGFLSGR